VIAFVLSGGGPRGALQAGALQILLEKGIRPDLLVGTSAGAINAAYLAADPTLAAAHRLGDIWRRLTKDQIYAGGILRAVWHLLSHRDSIYCNDRLRALLESYSSGNTRLFRGLAVRLYIVATDLLTRQPYVFGENPEEPLLDALMASSALPPALPPWRYGGHLFVDGAVSANLPVGVAIEKGATEIYALEAREDAPVMRLRPNVIEVAVWSIETLMHQQRDREMALCEAHPGVTLHHLVLSSRQRLSFDDFGKAATLISEGRETAMAYLDTWRAAAVGRRYTLTQNWRHGLRQVKRRVAVSVSKTKTRRRLR
jgi:NTE family protein